MAFTSAIAKSTSHIRSTSLPSADHPLTIILKDHLKRLRTFEVASTPICRKLSGLKDMYEQVDDWLQLPLNQQPLLHSQHCECMDDVLDRSLRLLDVCGTARDMLLQIKASMQELESSLRRKRGNSCSTTDIQVYLKSRKNLKRVIERSMGELNKMKKPAVSPPSEGKETNVLDMLREVQQTSIMVFESLLSVVCQKTTGIKPSGWSVVSKLLRSKKSAACANELEDLDANLLLVWSNKDINVAQAQSILKRMEALESTFQELEDDLESVFRSMLKTRVSILNMFTL